MSSESESEEFFDAFDITPSKIGSCKPDNSSTFVTESKTSAIAILQKTELDCLKENLVSKKDIQCKAVQLCNQNPWRSRTNSPLPDASSQLTLSNKTSSLPTLHFQDNSCSQLQSQSSTHLLLMTLEKPQFSNEEENSSSLMPPPKETSIPPPPMFDVVESSKEDEEDSSVCSGSLLESLLKIEKSRSEFKSKGRRHRQRKVNLNPEEEEEPPCNFPHESPEESQSSSVDLFFPSSQTSAPFRVVEVDATSVYSTTFSQDKGSKQFLKLEEEENNAKEEMDKNYESRDINVKEKESIVPLSPEPDIVASTKSNSLPRCGPLPSVQHSTPISEIVGENLTSPSLPCSPKIFVDPPPGPVAPPRKNKKRRRNDEDENSSISSVFSLPTPSLTMAYKDADIISQHLDLHAASKGDYIVCSQDSETSKAPGSSDSVILRTESTGDTTSQASTPETTRASSLCSSHEKLKHKRSSLLSQKFSISVKESTTPLVQLPHGTKSSCQGLTDEEILKQVSVLNLDTGERIPLSEAEECLPAALNPLSLHIMRLTSEYISTKGEDEEESDEESVVDVNVRKLPELDTLAVKKKTIQLKKLLGRTVESAVHKAKTLAQRGKEEKDIFEDDAPAQNTMQYVKIKTSHSHKGPHEFDNLMYVQELKGEHTGPVWCMKFSPCGRLLATAGQDHILRVWVLKQAFNYFLDIRTKWNADVKSSPTPSQESLVSQHSSHSSEDIGVLDPTDDGLAPFMPKPFCVYSGHTADVLDLSWSKNYFMLTSSMDKTVRLWHISRKECLCIFKHVDFVTAIAFHPKDDRYFISGSLDGKLRLWSIPDKQVVMWNEVEGHPKLITAANFCQNGLFTVVGTYNGRCIFYKTEELKYFTQIHVKSSRGKNSRGRKITGIEPLPEKDMLLITSNDSRIRLYDLNVLTVACKYKGYSNDSSQIRAGFSHDGKYIIAGSENQCIYIWKTHHDYSKFSSARKDRNVYWEGVKAHSAVVNCAIFSPRPEHVFNFIEQQETFNKAKAEDSQNGETVSPSSNGSSKEISTSNKGYVLVSADFNGCVKVFLKKEKPKHSSLPASALV